MRFIGLWEMLSNGFHLIDDSRVVNILDMCNLMVRSFFSQGLQILSENNSCDLFPAGEQGEYRQKSANHLNVCSICEK